MSSWAEIIEDQVVLTLCDVQAREEDKSLSPPSVCRPWRPVFIAEPVDSSAEWLLCLDFVVDGMGSREQEKSHSPVELNLYSSVYRQHNWTHIIYNIKWIILLSLYSTNTFQDLLFLKDVLKVLLLVVMYFTKKVNLNILERKGRSTLPLLRIKLKNTFKVLYTMVCSPGNEPKKWIYLTLPQRQKKFRFPLLCIAFVLIASGKKTCSVEESVELKICKTKPLSWSVNYLCRSCTYKMRATKDRLFFLSKPDVG